MNRTDATFLAVSLAILAFVAVYAWNPPAPRYYPLENEWRMEKISARPSMGWYGRSALGLGASLICGAGAYLLARRRNFGIVHRNDDGESTLLTGAVSLLAFLSLAALVLLAALIVRNEFFLDDVAPGRKPSNRDVPSRETGVLDGPNANRHPDIMSSVPVGADRPPANRPPWPS